jgi:hypothetical protein
MKDIFSLDKIWWVIVPVSLFVCVFWLAGKTEEYDDLHVYRVVIIKFVEYYGLDYSNMGFVDGLSKFGFVDNEIVKINYKILKKITQIAI